MAQEDETGEEVGGDDGERGFGDGGGVVVDVTEGAVGHVLEEDHEDPVAEEGLEGFHEVGVGGHEDDTAEFGLEDFAHGVAVIAEG